MLLSRLSGQFYEINHRHLRLFNGAMNHLYTVRKLFGIRLSKYSYPCHGESISLAPTFEMEYKVSAVYQKEKRHILQ